jgi:Fur family ferric uptake transcriptional regulator
MTSKLPLSQVDVASSPEQRFEEYLQLRGMRNTAQRRMLLEHVFSKHDHFDAEQLMQRLPRKGQKGYISRPTVYRTLAEFVDAGLLRKFELDGRSVYEHDYGYPPHDHLYCTCCQRLFEFQSEDLMRVRDDVARRHDFQVATHRLMIRGVCGECRRKRRRVPRRVDLI